MAANDALIAEATEVQAELLANTLGERLAVIDKLTDALKLADAACEKAEHERLYWRRRFHSMRKRARFAEAATPRADDRA